MSEHAERIERFRFMAESDPTNDMAWFSLGTNLHATEAWSEAAEALRKCVDLNPGMSRGWELLGASLIEAGDPAAAAEVLEKGHAEASSRGDLMPVRAMEDLLASIGREPPKSSPDANAAAEALRASGTFVCKRTGKPGTKMDSPPFKGPVGAWLGEHVAQETWEDWIQQGTKVINELRLDFSRDEDQETYDRYMYEFLGLDDEKMAEIREAAS